MEGQGCFTGGRTDMAGLSLIIEIGTDSVRSGVFGPRLEPLDFFIAPMPAAEGSVAPSVDALRGALGSLIDGIRSKGYAGVLDGKGRVLIGLPGQVLSIRIVSLPFEDRRKIAEILPIELGGLLHMDVEDAVVGALPLGNGKAFGVAIEKRLMREYLALFSGMGLDPVWAGYAGFSIPALIAGMYGKEGAKAFIGPGYLVVSDNGNIKFCKPVTTLEGVKLALTYLDAEGMRVDEAYVSGWEISIIEGLLPDARCEELKPLGHGFPPEGAGVMALSIVLKRGGLDETVNFRTGEFEYTKEKLEMRRSLRYTLLIIGIIFVLLGADIYLRHLKNYAELQSYRETLRSSYLQLFPDDKTVTDEVYAMQTRIKALKDELKLMGGGGRTLDILAALAVAGEGGRRVSFTEVFIGEGRVTAKGEAGSFEGAEYLKDFYRKNPMFADVTVSDVKAAPEGGAAFSLSITLAEGQDGP